MEACEAPVGYAEQKWDCDEGDPDNNPDAIEVCDGKDNDCDDIIDENTVVDATKWYADYDGDGYGDDASEYTSCEAPPDFVSIPGDCNVLDPLIHPGAEERCDTEIDDNCNDDTNDVDSVGCSSIMLIKMEMALPEPPLVIAFQPKIITARIKKTVETTMFFFIQTWKKAVPLLTAIVMDSSYGKTIITKSLANQPFTLDLTSTFPIETTTV